MFPVMEFWVILVALTFCCEDSWWRIVPIEVNVALVYIALSCLSPIELLPNVETAVLKVNISEFALSLSCILTFCVSNVYISWTSICMTLSDHSENIPGGRLFNFFCEIWVSPSKDWQNLGTPSLRIDRIWVPLPLHIIFNNTPKSVLWSYLSYFSFLIISNWQKLWRFAKHCAPPPKWRNLGTPQKPPHFSLMFSGRSLILLLADALSSYDSVDLPKAYPLILWRSLGFIVQYLWS